MINDVLDNITEIAVAAIEQMKTGSIEEKAFMALNNFIAIAAMAKGAKSMAVEALIGKEE